MRSPFIWLSGAHREVLEQVPSDRPRYQGLGGVVLTTATLAGLSCGFALRFALNVPLVFCVVLGLLWALAILNLDRWLISATPRRDTVLKNFLQILPRLFVALIIGVVISTPLTLQIFHREINQQLEVIQQRGRTDFATKSAAESDRVAALQKEMTRYADAKAATRESPIVMDHPKVVTAGKLLATARTARDQALARYNQELRNGAVSAGTRNALTNAQGTLNGRTRSYNLARDAAVKELNALGAANADDARTAYETARTNQSKAKAEFQNSNEKNSGLLARLEALRELTSKNGTLQRAYLMLMLFITTIELLPVLVKFMISLGPPSSYERTLMRFEAAREREAEERFDEDNESRRMTRRFRATAREEDARSTEAIERAARERKLEEELRRVVGRQADANARFGPM
jgi:hypothetical protein